MDGYISRRIWISQSTQESGRESRTNQLCRSLSVSLSVLHAKIPNEQLKLAIAVTATSRGPDASSLSVPSDCAIFRVSPLSPQQPHAKHGAPHIDRAQGPRDLLRHLRAAVHRHDRLRVEQGPHTVHYPLLLPTRRAPSLGARCTAECTARATPGLGDELPQLVSTCNSCNTCNRSGR